MRIFRSFDFLTYVTEIAILIQIFLFEISHFLNIVYKISAI